ncbi:hypothetical protein [Segeticoccus rhizosphaerae]|jgi:hypothetical protein|uniref:hypothetical protein n=2 Tax=Segeticoccus rhizosphaerae TaxID=1104777 RepID=UPI0010C0463B|nr:hypothetical protein [Ornithinicoccus soli]
MRTRLLLPAILALALGGLTGSAVAPVATTAPVVTGSDSVPAWVSRVGQLGHGLDSAPPVRRALEPQPVHRAVATPMRVPGVNPVGSSAPCLRTGTGGYRFQAIYATAKGYPDRYRTVAPRIRQWIGEASTEVWFASAGRSYGQRMRWVTSEPASGRCVVSVRKVVVPASAYAGPARLWAHLRRLGYTSPRRHYVVWAETPPRQRVCGLGETFLDDTPRPADNWHNRMALFAWLTPPCWEGGLLHEALHTLGAVQPGAPYASAHGHCRDTADIMCYQDASGTRLVRRCAVPLRLRQPFAGMVDCGRDTYYNVSPRKGSYLARHWNVARSPFLQRTGPAPLGPRVASASGPRTARIGRPFTLRSAGRRTPAGAYRAVPFWVAPAGCGLSDPYRATTRARCTKGTGRKVFRAAAVDRYGRVGVKSVVVRVTR